MLNEGQFAGTGGWVLKPSGYREPSGDGGGTVPAGEPNSVPAQSKVELAMELLAGQDLPIPQEASKPEDLRPFVPQFKAPNNLLS